MVRFPRGRFRARHRPRALVRRGGYRLPCGPGRRAARMAARDATVRTIVKSSAGGLMKIRSLLWLSAFTIFIGCSGTNVGNSCTSDDQCGTFKCLRDQRVTTNNACADIPVSHNEPATRPRANHRRARPPNPVSPQRTTVCDCDEGHRSRKACAARTATRRHIARSSNPIPRRTTRHAPGSGPSQPSAPSHHPRLRCPTSPTRTPAHSLHPASSPTRQPPATAPHPPAPPSSP